MTGIIVVDLTTLLSVVMCCTSPCHAVVLSCLRKEEAAARPLVIFDLVHFACNVSVIDQLV